jgi:hypothetical protein
MSSGSKERNPDMHFLFLTRVPVKEPNPRSPTGPLCRERPIYRAFCLHLSQIPSTKISLNKETCPFSQKPQKKKRPSMFPKTGPYRNRRPFPEPYLAYPSGSPVKEPSLQVPFIELNRVINLLASKLFFFNFSTPCI